MDRSKFYAVLRARKSGVFGTRLDMGPTLALPDKPNKRARYAKVVRNILLGFTRVKPRLYCPHRRFIQLSRVSLAKGMTATFQHIVGVVFLGSDQEVLRIAARRVIAGMANYHAGRNAPAIGDLPRGNVRVAQPVRTRTTANLAVPKRMPPPLPFPAIVGTRSFDFRP